MIGRSITKAQSFGVSNKCVNGFGGPNANNLFMRVEDPVEMQKRLAREA